MRSSPASWTRSYPSCGGDGVRARRWSINLATLTVSLACVSGCGGPRAVIIPAGEPVQLAEDVYAYVYVQTSAGKVRSGERTRLPHGWWVLPDTED